MVQQRCIQSVRIEGRVRSAIDAPVMRYRTLRSIFAIALLAFITALPFPVIALDTSTGVGLQDRALFQERVDYTPTKAVVIFMARTCSTHPLQERRVKVQISAAPTSKGRSLPKQNFQRQISMAPI
jgi:hypothetical protein